MEAFPKTDSEQIAFGIAATCQNCARATPIRSDRRGPSVCDHCLLTLALRPSDASCFDFEDATVRLESRRFGPYLLIEEIGRGGMGVVYRAVHEESGEMVAVKTVLPQDVGCAEALERFSREARAAQQLSHPNLMQLREVGVSTAGLPFFSMEFAGGGSLQNLGTKYRGRWRQIAQLIAKLSRAVHHAHQQGLLHRDLKPGNVLFTDDHEPLIIDFGLAKQINGSSDLTQISTILGTPNYVAPEQASGKTRDLTAAADIYSLGAILFELLTGRPPFVGENPLAVLQQAATNSPPLPSRLVASVPKLLETICMRCLEHRPTDRYRSCIDLADDLDRWISGRPIKARSVLTRMLYAFRSRTTSMVWSASIFVAFAAALLIWKLSKSMRPPTTVPLPVAVAIENYADRPESLRVAGEIRNALRLELEETGIFRVQNADASELSSSTGVFDPIAYGRATNSRFVLAGFLRNSGDQSRLTLRLVRCGTEKTVWRYTDQTTPDRTHLELTPVKERLLEEVEAKSPSTSKPNGSAPNDVQRAEAEILYTRAMELAAHANRRDLNGAVELFRRASETDQKYSAPRAMHAFALWTLAEIYQEWDKLPDALSRARETLILDPQSAQAYRVVGSCYMSSARNAEALEEFWRAVELTPRSAGCCVSLGICLRALGHLDQALPWMTRAVQLDPTRGTLYATLGETLALCERDKEAEVAIKRAIDLDNGQSELQIDLGALRVWQERFDDARAICAQLRTTFPDSRYGLSLAAWLELCDGKQEARTFFEELREQNSYGRNWKFFGAVNPSSALAYVAYKGGLIEKAHQLADEALKVDRDLLRDHPGDPRLLHDIAATLFVTGDSELAWQYLQKAVAAGWVEFRSTKIDPRFSSVAGTSRFNETLLGRGRGSFALRP